MVDIGYYRLREVASSILPTNTPRPLLITFPPSHLPPPI